VKRILIPILAALILAAVCAPQAPAATITCDPCSYPYQAWADESKMPTPEVTLEVIETTEAESCPGSTLNFGGCTRPSEAKIWLAPEMIGRAFPRGTLYHEIGHNVDADLLPEWMRIRFMAVLGMSPPWSANVAEVDYWPPSEKFAETYAECAVKPWIGRHEHLWGRGPVYGSEPIGGRHRHNVLCRMIAKL
jgi:hypothetical protein